MYSLSNDKIIQNKKKILLIIQLKADYIRLKYKNLFKKYSSI